MITLQNLIRSISFDDLPFSWKEAFTATFSREKQLWGYQEEALRNAIKVLWKYYEDGSDYHVRESDRRNLERKRYFYDWYRSSGLGNDLDIKLGSSHRIRELLSTYYEIEDDSISYEHFINRCCFWMATGSGKTLVLVKLIQILRSLGLSGEIPRNEILVLTQREDLIEHLKNHVLDFNRSQNGLNIDLRDLREYPRISRYGENIRTTSFLTVYYYRSDNIGDDQKEKIIDFRNYENGGRWYILLDEAHKGDREESKRQHMYSILSREGFLFNFSATFADQRDVVTSAFNFNLSRFTTEGYGKHILLLRQEFKDFHRQESERYIKKTKVLLKSLLLLTYIKRFERKVRKIDLALYHKPMQIILVHTVDTKQADLKMVFRELADIARGNIDLKTFVETKKELQKELSERSKYFFEDRESAFTEKEFEAIEYRDLLKCVFNGSGFSEIEVSVRPSNHQEIALKLKTGSKPFALIKIGDISRWLTDELTGYAIVRGYEDESYFTKLNESQSDVNILMGSRGFHEGWDSNRPNVITFVNIGVGSEAKKFVLQAIGRGVRIEPKKNYRRRMHYEEQLKIRLIQKHKDIGSLVEPLETLYLFATNRGALQSILTHLDSVRERQIEASDLNSESKEDSILIPKYFIGNQPCRDGTCVPKLVLRRTDLDFLEEYVDSADDRVILMRHEVEPWKIFLIRKMLKEKNKFFSFEDGRHGASGYILNKVFHYMEQLPIALRGNTRSLVKVGTLGETKIKWGREQLRRKEINSSKNIYTPDKKSLKSHAKTQHRGILENKITRILGSESTPTKCVDSWRLIERGIEDSLIDIPWYDAEKELIRVSSSEFTLVLRKGSRLIYLLFDTVVKGADDFDLIIDSYKHLFQKPDKSLKNFFQDGIRLEVIYYGIAGNEKDLRSRHPEHITTSLKKAITSALQKLLV